LKLLRYEITGLFGRSGSIEADFRTDLNIFTGRNGAGKTTVMKLLWYVMSGNILHALNEVPFSKVYIETDRYECTVFRLSKNTCKVEFKETEGSVRIFEDEVDIDGDMLVNAEDEANPAIREHGTSVFFPTFRRIEGGFTLSASRQFGSGRSRVRSDIEDALIALSRKLSNDPHVFVSSISTVDIVSILLRQYADLSDLSSTLQESTSQEIINTIKQHKADPDDKNSIEAASSLLDTIRAKIEGMELKREEILAPFDEVRKVIEGLFRNIGINIGTRLSFGNAAGAVNSDALSAGEKQMLSFICYNAFYKDAIVFIDEPELSLHVDWQRMLFPILMRQQSTNQFIISTHSPFIYSKFPQNEISLDIDRGDQAVVS